MYGFIFYYKQLYWLVTRVNSHTVTIARRSLPLILLSPDAHRQDGHTPYPLTAGGATSMGAWGYIEAWREMMEQVW